MSELITGNALALMPLSAEERTWLAKLSTVAEQAMVIHDPVPTQFADGSSKRVIGSEDPRTRRSLTEFSLPNGTVSYFYRRQEGVVPQRNPESPNQRFTWWQKDGGDFIYACHDDLLRDERVLEIEEPHPVSRPRQMRLAATSIENWLVKADTE